MADAKKTLLRIIDANLNRCREGLRVIEDISRFYLNDGYLTKCLKGIRHQLLATIKQSKQIVLSREVLTDVGRGYQPLEGKREDIFDLAIANFRRSEESLRVLEEIAKIVIPAKAQIFKRLRFQVYRIEKKFYLAYD